MIVLSLENIWDRLLSYYAATAPSYYVPEEKVRVAQEPYAYVINIDHDDELEMMRAPPEARLGSALVAEIARRGIRAALPAIYGMQIEWGKEDTYLVRVMDAEVIAR